MRSFSRLFVAASLAAPLSCSSGDSSATTTGDTSRSMASEAEVRQELSRVFDQYARDAEREDVKAIAAVYTEDAVLMEPNMKDIRGRPAIEAFVTDVLKTVAIKDVKISTAELDVHDGTAYEIGTYSEIVIPDGKAENRVNGRYSAIWKRQSDGSWKIHRLIVNSTDSLPAQR